MEKFIHGGGTYSADILAQTGTTASLDMFSLFAAATTIVTQ